MVLVPSLLSSATIRAHWMQGACPTELGFLSQRYGALRNGRMFRCLGVWVGGWMDGRRGWTELYYKDVDCNYSDYHA